MNTSVPGWTAFFWDATVIRATMLRTLDVYYVFIHPQKMIQHAFAEIPQCSLICRCCSYFQYRSNLLSVLALSTNCRAMFQLLDSLHEGPQQGSSIPRSRLEFSLDPVITTVYTSQSRSCNFVLVHFLNVRGPSHGNNFLPFNFDHVPKTDQLVVNKCMKDRR